jgi:hypothetical protein
MEWLIFHCGFDASAGWLPRSIVVTRGLSNEPHLCGFPEGLLAQPFYGWVKWRREFLRGLSASFPSTAFSQLVVAAKAWAGEPR